MLCETIVNITEVVSEDSLYKYLSFEEVLEGFDLIRDHLEEEEDLYEEW